MASLGSYRSGEVMAVPLESFYPFGENNGDSQIGPTLDGGAQLNLTQNFTFFGESYSVIYVNNNGDVSFNDLYSDYTPDPFPRGTGPPIIAPFWADSDTQCNDSGNVFYRETTSASIRSQAANDFLHLSSAFYPSFVIIATWYQIEHYRCVVKQNNKTNTFQLVLATDGSRSFALFLYLDDGIQWTTGDVDGTNGLGGTEAQVGYDAGDYINYYTINGSMTPSIVDIETTSNVGIPGMYVFDVNPSPAPPNIQPASGSDVQIAVYGENYTIEFRITDDFPLVETVNILWVYQKNFTSIAISWPLSLESEVEKQRHYLSNDRRSLTIRDVQISDEGYYTLIANNSVGEGNNTILLLVHVKPKLVNNVGTVVEGNEQGMAIFNCSAYGIPAPNIIWQRNGQLVIDTANKFKIEKERYNITDSQGLIPELEGTFSLLMVSSLTTMDSGNYSCRADNNAGPGVVMKIPYVLFVTATDPASCAFSPCANDGVCSAGGAEYMCQCTGQNCESVGPIEIPPVITKPPVDTVGQLYSEVELSCVATGNPQPTILWYKDGHRLTDAVADFPTLVFPSLDLTDRGFYNCEAFSLQGGQRVSDISEPIILNIEGIVQYEADILLPDNFYENRKKRQSEETTEQEKINELVSAINQLLSGSQISINSSFFFVELQNHDSTNFTNSLLVLPVVFTLITEEEIGEQLRQMVETELMQIGAELSVTIQIGEVERFDGCQADTTVIPSQSGNSDLKLNIFWPETSIGVTAYVNCPCGNLTIGTNGEQLQAHRLCGGDFSNGGEWQAAFVDPCNFTDLARNICRIAELGSTEEKVEALEALTEDAGSLGTIEVAASVTVLVTTTDDVGGNLTLTDDFLSVVDNLLDVNEGTLQESQGTANTSAKLLEAVQLVTAEIPIPPNHTGPVILPQDSFAVSVQEVDPEEFDTQIFSASLESNPFSNPNLELNEDSLAFSPVTSSTASLTLPQNLFDSLTVSNSSRIALSVFLTDALYLRRNNTLLEVGSVVLSASVINKTIDQLDPPISLRFLKNPMIENVSDLLCTFWDPQLDDEFGDWSSEGCRRDESYNISDEFVTCYCNHLTSFSVLLDLSPSPASANDEVDIFLSAATYIGCIVSILCLLLTIATYLFSKKLRQSDHGQLLLNLCFALLSLYFFFILAVHSTAVTGFCMLVAALLQYFFLVSFMAMAAEALNLYMKLVVVLGSRISYYTLKAGIICWVTPVFIILFTFAPKPTAYANDYFCRPVGTSFYIGMVVPFILIYVFNWIIFAIIITSICYKNCYKSTPSNASQHQKSGVSIRQQLTIAVMLSVLFGIGWGVGLLATEELGSKVAHDFFASLFVIITGFHGLLIFILHCLRSKDARKEWRRWFFKATKKEFSDFSSSTYGYVQLHIKTSSLRFPSQLKSSKTTKKSELTTGMVSLSYTTSGGEGTVKIDMMKQCELDNPCILQTLEEETYDLATVPELDTNFTKVDLAKMEAKQESIHKVDSRPNSIVDGDDVLQESPLAVTVDPLDLEHGEPKVNRLYVQDGEGEMEMKAIQQDKKQCLKEPIPSKLKEQHSANDEASTTKSALEMLSPIPPPAVEYCNTHDYPDESKD